MPAPLPKARDLILAPGEETPIVTRIHGDVLSALIAADLPKAQGLAADLLDHFAQVERREPGVKSRQLIEFVVLLS